MHLTDCRSGEHVLC